MNQRKARYTVKVVAPDSNVLLEYSRDHYGMISVADLLRECEGGLKEIFPIAGLSIHVSLWVQQQ